MARFNLIEAYGKAFGSAYDRVGTIAVIPQDSSFLNQPEIASNTNDTSLFGAQVHFPTSFNDYKLPNEPLISIRGKNKIVKTPIDGADGTFKELFSRDDYMITIKGIAINENDPDAYPDEIIRKIREFCEFGMVEVTNKLLSFFNVKYLAIDSYSFPAVEGVMWQAYEIKCLSDNSFKLDLDA